MATASHLFRTFTLWLAPLLSLAGASPAFADSLAPAEPTHIHATLVPERAGAPGETITLALVMQPAKDWHGYWSNPGDAGLAPTLDWTLPKGAVAGAMQFPVPQTLLVAGLMNHVYAHDYAILIPFTLPRDAKPGAVLPISAKAQWLACTATICVPEDAVLSTTVTVGTAAKADPRFADWRAALPHRSINRRTLRSILRAIVWHPVSRDHRDYRSASVSRQRWRDRLCGAASV